MDDIEILETIEEYYNDYDTLCLAIDILKIATNRLDKDLENLQINKEYNNLQKIIKKLETIKENYV